MNIYNHNDPELELLKKHLEKNQNNIAFTQDILKKISQKYLKKIHYSAHKHYSPIIILKGGLLMYEAALSIFRMPISFIFPKKEYLGKEICARADVVLLSHNSKYLLIDTIINTGKTANSCIKFLKENIDINDSDISFASIFSTQNGLKNIIKNNDIKIHSLWDNYDVNSKGLLKGVNYDAGNYASNQKDDIQRIIF